MAENEDGERLLHYLEEAHHVQKLHSSVKYGMRIGPVFNDFLEKAHEMWQQDKQEDGESDDEEEKEDYLPPLPAFKITSKNKYTYLGASVFLVKEFQEETDMSSRKRKDRDTPDDRADSRLTRRNVKQRAILHEDEMARLTPYPIKSMLKMGRSGIRFGSPVENSLLQNQKEFEKDLHLRAEEFWPHVYDDLTLDGSSQEGRIYGTKEAQRRIAVERMIQAQVKTARKSDPHPATLMKETTYYGC